MTMGCSRAFFELDDQEGVAILALFVGFASVCWPVLAANLGTGDVDRSKMLTTPLIENMIRNIARPSSASPVTHTFIVFQLRTLKNEKPRLPAPKILPAFRKVAFFVTISRNRFVCFFDDIRREKRDNLIVVLDGKVDECLNILL